MLGWVLTLPGKGGNRFTRVYNEEGSIFGVEMKFFDTIRTGKGEGNLLCKN